MSERKVPSIEILIDLYVNRELNAREIGDMYNVSRGKVLDQLKKHGIEIRKQVGKHHAMWKGGKITKGSGYVGIWKPDHPSADKQGYVYEHTLVMEQKIGRVPVKGKESVHHVDGDKQNNHPDNLYLCTHKSHVAVHRQIEQLMKHFLRKGLVTFDHEKGEYILNDED